MHRDRDRDRDGDRDRHSDSDREIRNFFEGKKVLNFFSKKRDKDKDRERDRGSVTFSIFLFFPFYDRHVNESCQTRMNKSCHACDGVMSHSIMRHSIDSGE